jgi:RNA recognition motif-containing protein
MTDVSGSTQIDEQDHDAAVDDQNTEKKTKKKLKEVTPSLAQQTGGVRKIRKARRQVAKRKNLNLQREEGGGDYNIWYHKYIGQNRERTQEADPATTRCSIMKDSGWTIGCTSKDPFFCLFFARGCCDKGADCHFLHRLPTDSDLKRIPITKDCFGRDKFATDRDDMGGIGTFSRDNRTIYVSNLKNVEDTDMDEVVIRHFKEWGELEYVRVFMERCYAFLKYKNRLCAEFCKEAMTNQPLDHDEVIQIRWATDDPNPIAAKRNALELRQKLVQKIEDEGISTTNLSFDYPRDYHPEPVKLPEELEAVRQEFAEFQRQSSGDQNEQNVPQSSQQGESAPQRFKTAEELKKDVDYNSFIQTTMNENRAIIEKDRQQGRDLYEQRQVLNSEVADPYPNTEAQYQQQQYDAASGMTPDQYQQYVQDYYANYYKFYQQFYNQLQGDKR